MAGSKIGSADIRNDSIKSKDIKDGTIKQRDLRPGLRAKIGQPGPAGPQGPAGPPGTPGAPGESHDITAAWTANGESSTAGYTALLTGENTSVETTDLGVEVEAGDVISFEYTLLDGATCGGGGPRMFVTIGENTENTFDADTNCGENGEVVYVLQNGGTISDAGLVHDNGSGGSVYITDVMVDGHPVYFGDAGAAAPN